MKIDCINELLSFQKTVTGFAVEQIGIFCEFGSVFLSQVFVTETNHAFKPSISIGKARDVILRSPCHAVHDHVEDI